MSSSMFPSSSAIRRDQSFKSPIVYGEIEEVAEEDEDEDEDEEDEEDEEDAAFFIVISLNSLFIISATCPTFAFSGTSIFIFSLWTSSALTKTLMVIISTGLGGGKIWARREALDEAESCAANEHLRKIVDE